MGKYRTNADGSAVCPHRDLSVCTPCAAADRMLVEVEGVHFLALTNAERIEFLAIAADVA